MNSYEKTDELFDEKFRIAGGTPKHSVLRNEHIKDFIHKHYIPREHLRKMLYGMMFDLTPEEDNIAAGMTKDESDYVRTTGRAYLKALEDVLTALNLEGDNG